jgi:hypothetical protein
MDDREVLLRYFREQLEPITADKRGIVIPRSSLRRLRLPLDAARNEVPFKCEGDMLYADSDSTGVITVRLNSESEDPWPIKAQGGVQNIPMREILVTHAAQAGKVLNLWYGYRARFVAPSADIATIGSILNRVGVTFDFDRNAVTKLSTYSGTSIAPHADTQRWAYTVPATKKFAIAYQRLRGERNSNASVAGINTTRIRVTPSGGAATDALSFTSSTVAVPANKCDITAPGGVLMANDLIEARTGNTDTAGTLDYDIQMRGFEFDA